MGVHNKYFIIKMALLPKAEILKLDCLTNSGVITKYISLSNLIPVVFEDFQETNRRKMLEMPSFLDHELIYYNTFNQEYYVFDKESVWNKEGIDHPAFDLTVRYNEKLWYDHLRIL